MLVVLQSTTTHGLQVPIYLGRKGPLGLVSGLQATVSSRT